MFSHLNRKGFETGLTVYSPYQRRYESLTICGCNYKGSTQFLLSYLKNRPPAWQPDARPTEPPVHVKNNAKGSIATFYGTYQCQEKFPDGKDVETNILEKEKMLPDKF